MHIVHCFQGHTKGILKNHQIPQARRRQCLLMKLTMASAMCLANFDKALSSVSGHASDASAAICRKAVVAKHIRFQFPHYVSLCKPGMWHCATPLKMVGIQIDQLLLKLDINCA